MFRSFFPQPLIFFSSALGWSLIAIFAWFNYFNILPGCGLLLQVTMQQPLPATIERFIAPGQIWFYAYYWLSTTIFAFIWRMIANHPWQAWSVWGSSLIIFVTWLSVQVGVDINAWYGPFYDMIQQSLTKAGSIYLSQFYSQALDFLGIALIAVVIGVMNSFFVSHWVFRWRTAMNNYYIYNWQHLRIVEGAAQRVQEDTMRFSSMLEDWGVSFIQAIMTLAAFLPVLIALSHHVTQIPILGNIPYALVFAALLWAILGTIFLVMAGVKLPSLEFRNQRVEAAYRKELIYGEDIFYRATPPTVQELFSRVQKNYFRLYFHYLYFNMTRILYLQIDSIFGLFMLFPSIVAGVITLGLLNQIINVFDQVRSSFQYLINSWSTLITLISIYKRLRKFEQILESILIVHIKNIKF
ncbi:peptide antibiotic transporter SbmA [Pantoea sp. Mhis]|uniref:peptide antibiotic transporter SbmA n=1 Tax=Pantoea sp. Mhis TaxID=2576759 RepID=UPI001357A2BB|nr:peptide antibiotic transporter SbmA [Pantoea sp. Mhis]MXP56767.1 peptide antibiotic transporter SbmA [Pantoea sp. Mhis]